MNGKYNLKKPQKSCIFACQNKSVYKHIFMVDIIFWANVFEDNHIFLRRLHNNLATVKLQTLIGIYLASD